MNRRFSKYQIINNMDISGYIPSFVIMNLLLFHNEYEWEKHRLHTVSGPGVNLRGLIQSNQLSNVTLSPVNNDQICKAKLWGLWIFLINLIKFHFGFYMTGVKPLACKDNIHDFTNCTPSRIHKITILWPYWAHNNAQTDPMGVLDLVRSYTSTNNWCINKVIT